MRYPILVFILFLLASCGSGASKNSSEPIKAVYFVQGTGQLSEEDLQAHPEVVVTGDFNEVKRLARSKVALWIDANAVSVVDLDWLSEVPQSFYPVVLVGNGDAACSFFQALPYFTFEVPCCLDCASSPPGFSVNIQTSISGGQMQGYEGTPTVQRILDITNVMLERVK